MNIKKIKEVCDLRPQKREAKLKLSDEALVSFVPMNNLGILSKNLNLYQEKKLKDVYKGYVYFAENDILLAKITPCFENGKLGIARNLKNGIGFGSSEYIVLRSKGEIDPEYLFYFLSQEKFRAEGRQVLSGAVGQQRVPNEFVENYLVPVPPIEEQKRIVEILDKAFEGIAQAEANTRRNLINARELFDSYIARVFSCKKDNWLETTLGDSCFFFNGKAHEKNIDKYGKFIVVNSKFISSNGSIEKRTNFDLFPLLINDIVMVMSDVPKGKALGKCYLIEQNNKYSLNQRICAIRSNKFNSLFLYYQLNRNYYFLKFDNQENQTNLRKDDILKCPLYLPPIDEQKEIASDLTQFKENGLVLETIYQRKLEAIAELKQSILEKAFTGQLSQ